MTEIKIEKKKPIWPWILGGLAVAALLLLFFYNKEDKSINVTDAGKNGPNNNAIEAFISYADSDTTAMSLDHEYTHNALLKLAAATKYLADSTGYQGSAEIDEAKMYADKINNDPNVTTHADNIKKATGLLGNVLVGIQKANFPDLGEEAGQVSAASDAINTETLTLDQKTRIKSFFNKASDLLKKID